MTTGTFIRYTNDGIDIFGIRGIGRLVSYDAESNTVVIYPNIRHIGLYAANVAEMLSRVTTIEASYSIGDNMMYRLKADRENILSVQSVIDYVSREATGFTVVDVMTIEEHGRAFDRITGDFRLGFEWFTHYSDSLTWYLTINDKIAIYSEHPSPGETVISITDHIIENRGHPVLKRYGRDLSIDIMRILRKKHITDKLALQSSYQVTSFESEQVLCKLAESFKVSIGERDLTASRGVHRTYSMGK